MGGAASNAWTCNKACCGSPRVDKNWLDLPDRAKSSFGAFSVAGSLEEGVSPEDRRYGEALPKGRSADGEPFAWTGETKVYTSNGTPVFFCDYLRQKVEEGMPKKPTKGFASQLEISESDQFTFPFKIFVFSIFRLLTTNSVYHSHEENFPISLWHGNYGKIRELFKNLESDPELERLVKKPVFIHIGSANRNLIPVTSAGPGKSTWGVMQQGESGYEEQQRFWSEAPQNEGPHGWRVLAGAEMFRVKGAEKPEVMKKLLSSAHALYSVFSDDQVVRSDLE